MNYCNWLFDTQKQDLGREIIIDGETGKRLTFKELQTEVLKVANFLKSKGYEPGTVIATHLYNGAEAAIVFLAIEYIGCVACLVDPLFKADEVPYYIKDSASKCLVTHLEKEEIVGALTSEVDVVNVREIQEICEKDEFEKPLSMYDFEENELALLLYTSGSTSTPKGVMLTTGCCYTFLRKNHQSMYRYEPDDRILCFVPFSHGFGSISVLIPALAYKAGIVFQRTFHPAKVAEMVLKENITHMLGVPTHYRQLLRYEPFISNLGKLKAAFCSAAPISCEVAKLWYEKTGIYLDEGYGMSEATTLITTRMSRLPSTSGDVGFWPEGIISVDIVDDNDRVVENGAIGEIRVTGQGLMLGYLNRPAETSERLRNGYLYTGDLGYKNPDGSLVVCGRKTEFINVAGLKISPVEVETALNSHSDVIDSAAVGVEDEVYGEVVKAFVIKKQDSSLTERELIKYVSDKLANFKVPKYISFVKEFPRNNVGKVDKKALKNM
ncbi:class I adenylate-forming enzyme family protein [Acetivibrio straminisolvens]|jgi:long-chain acyl-CoA synthetase|uniref:class I adenylate-forming enzyme family protein n=1 Tax=Acetivibrio straminisolvens TaxID=253314 RepID=UPI00223E99FF|nr:class I adenylate-forming enzyme family protein [Acetivibrio straminisolvens]